MDSKPVPDFLPGILPTETIRQNMGEICWLAAKYRTEAADPENGIQKEHFYSFVHSIGLCELLSESETSDYWTIHLSLDEQILGAQTIIIFKRLLPYPTVVRVQQSWNHCGLTTQLPDWVPHFNNVIHSLFESSSRFDDAVRSRILFRKLSFVEESIP